MSLKKDEKEFLNHVKLHQGILRKVCYVYCKTESEKEDLYQEILFQMWRSYGTFSGRSYFLHGCTG